jgi:hypothetical protein
MNKQANKVFCQLFMVDGRYKDRHKSVLPVVHGRCQIQKGIYNCKRQIRRQIRHPEGLVK